MLKNYLKMIFRIWRRDKIATSVNIIGLAVGLAVSFLILLYVFYENSYDRFHQHSDRLYRVITQNVDTGYYSAITPIDLSNKLLAEFPEIEHAGQALRGPVLVEQGDIRFYENRVLATDAGLLETLTFPLAAGDISTALRQSFPILITEEMAGKYFPGMEPLGKNLALTEGGSRTEFTVAGVLKDIPHQSHLQMDFITPMINDLVKLNSDVGVLEEINYRSNILYTYVMLRQGVDPKEVEKKLSNFIERNIAPANVYPYTYHLQPITDIHLSNLHVNQQMEPPSDPRTILFLSVIGLFIIIIAMINYVVLTTAKSAKRLKEIGLRKVVGAYRRDLIQQIFLEAGVVVLCAVPLAILVIELVLPKVNQLLDVNLGLNLFQNVWLVVGMIGITLVVGVSAAGYVVFYFIKYYPADILKKPTMAAGKKSGFQNALVAAQMIMFIGLIISSIVIKEQMEFIRDNETLGFEKENIISVPISIPSLRPSYALLKNELKSHPAIEYVTGSSAEPPAYNTDLSGRKLVTDPETGRMWTILSDGPSRNQLAEFEMIYENNRIDYDYIEALGIKVIAGESFSEENPISDAEASQYALVNEAFVKYHHIENPVGKEFQMVGNSRPTIVGVVQDFHTRSLYDPIEPLILYRSIKYVRQLIVKSAGGRLGEALALVEEKWKVINPNIPFEYSILEDTIDQMYRTEENLQDIVGYLTLAAILIACAGLFGLSLHITEQRTKEIGIRKILGASLLQMLNLQLKKFCFIVMISAVIATPLAYYVMDQWLQNFTYRIDLGLDIFVLAGLLALVIALATVSWQTVRAATANPVESLRYE